MEVFSTVCKTQSTAGEAPRFLDCDYDLVSPRAGHGLDARSLAWPRTNTSHGEDADDGADTSEYIGQCTTLRKPVLRRSITTMTTTYYVAEPAEKAEDSGRLATPSVAGSLVSVLLGIAVGAAAGAALTYTMGRQDRSRAPDHMTGSGPVLLRRATLQNRPLDPKRPFTEPEKAYYPGEATSAAHCAPSWTRPPSSRARSEAETRRTPFILADTEYRSRVGTEHRSHADTDHRSHNGTTKHRSHADTEHSSTASYRCPPSVQRSHTSSVLERASYVSAKSHCSSSASRPSPTVVSFPVDSVIGAGGKTAARSAGSSAYSVRPSSRANTAVTDRKVTLAPGVGGSPSSRVDRAATEGNDDDDGSIVPSDSISNVDSRHGERSHG